jgi:outer membrane murein-binding lipoprotein Lpp
LSGEAASLPTTILYTTGNQIKSGRLIIGDTIVNPNSPYTLSLQTNYQDTFLEILNNGGSDKGGFVGMNGSDFELYNWQGGDIVFFTAENPSSGYDRLYIKNNGNIGIGTNIPSEKLQVVGNILANNLVYNTGNQTISGTKTFDIAPVVSGNILITGNLSLYATAINLATTGSTLDTKINNLSGYVTGADATFATITNLASTGSTFNSKINSLSGYVDSQDTSISNNLRTTGSTLDNKINSLSGNLTSTYSTITNLASTGSILDSKINSLSGWSASASNLASSGSTLDTKINSLSGWSASAANLASTGSNLNNSIISLSGLFTGFTGNLDATFATDAQLYTTGSTLDNKINSLSGNLTANYATITNLASTGSTLNTRINNLSGYINSSASNIVFTTGNQTISGTKTFIQDTTFGDSAQGDFLVISGNQFTVYGSGNFTSGLFVNGNAVLTGVNLSSYATTANLALTGSTLTNSINSLSGTLTGNYATILNLASTGSTLDTKINNLSGYVTGAHATFASITNLANTGSTLNTKIDNLSGVSVLRFGDQIISGVKTFIGNHNISGNTTVSGFINISGNYDLYAQIENSKKLALAYAIAL